MKEIGKLLQQTREEKGISLDEISKETKIQKRFLTQLEEGNFSSFSGEVYLKGALRNYAEAVGLKPQEIINLFNISKKKAPEGKYDEETKVGKGKIVPIKLKEKKPVPLAALIWISLLVFIGGGSIWYHYQQFHKNGEGIPFSEITPEKEPGNNSPDEIGQIEEPVAEGKLTLISSDHAELIYLLSGVKQQEIVLSFSGNCWFKLEQDGQIIEEKICHAGEVEKFGDSNETWLRLGNPPLVGIKVNEFAVNELINYNRPVNITIKKEM